MSLFGVLFHGDVASLEKIDKTMPHTIKTLKEMLSTYHLKIILIQELITAVRGSKEDEKKIDGILARLSQVVNNDEKLALQERSFVTKTEPIIQRLKEHEKDAGLRKKEQDIVEALGYFTQDLERADSLLNQQKNMLANNLSSLRHADAANKLAELARQEAEILFGIDGRQSSEERVLKDISVRIGDLIKSKSVTK